MNKTILRNLICAFTPGQAVTIQMRGRSAEGYTVLSTKKGKGKGGSWSASIQREDGTVLEIGTPRNLDVLNVTVEGTFYGVQNEREEPLGYPTHEAQATILKNSLKGLVGEPGKGTRIRLDSTVPQFNGVFVVERGCLEKGKYGQVHLWLRPENAAESDGQDTTVELWSHRHSGVITSFEVLSS